jgi:hypothetical protein
LLPDVMLSVSGPLGFIDVRSSLSSSTLLAVVNASDTFLNHTNGRVIVDGTSGYVRVVAGGQISNFKTFSQVFMVSALMLFAA